MVSGGAVPETLGAESEFAPGPSDQHREVSHTKKHATTAATPSQGAAVLAAGFEPARAFARRCAKPLRLPFSPRQHLDGYEPWQARWPRRSASHVLPTAMANVRRRLTKAVTRLCRDVPKVRRVDCCGTKSCDIFPSCDCSPEHRATISTNGRERSTRRSFPPPRCWPITPSGCQPLK